MPIDWRIEPLAASHNRKDFDCGEPPLNDYLRQYARQHAASNVSRTFVAVSDADPAKILGYYTLSMGGLTKTNLPAALQKKLPNFPIPIARLGRLAVDDTAQGKGMGEDLLMHALHRCVALSDEIGMLAVVVDAKHDKARQFYLRYGFEELPDQPLVLFIAASTIQELV